MKRVLTAVVLIPLVLLVVFRAPLWLFVPIIGAIVVLSLREYLSLSEKDGIRPFRWLTYVVGLLPLAVVFAEAIHALIFGRQQFPPDLPDQSDVLPAWLTVCVLAPIAFGILLVFRKNLQTGLASVSASLLAAFYIALPLSLLVDLRDDPFRRFLLVFILFSVWAGDIAAYYVGKNFGRHKLAPIVSPNKTWEGAAASIIASSLVAVAVFYFQPQINAVFSGEEGLWRPTFDPAVKFPVPWIHAIILGVLTNIAAQFGDLFESALKRGAGVKDSGALLPGHGGMLDRIDALLFAIPFAFSYAAIVGFLDKLVRS